MSDTTVIPVRGTDGMRDYEVHVGRGLLGDVARHLGPRVAKVLIVHAPALGARAELLREQLADRYEVLLAEVPDAEGAKRVEVAAFCWQILGQTDFTRSDAIIGLGGGATTDLAGFVAATWLRGIDVVQLPTTVLGMVDAAVGGKTGINTAEGKNLVGAFWAPRAVLCDLELLDTLPRNEILAGYAEVVKAGFIAEPEILDIVEADPQRATDPGTPEFRRAVELAIAMKARVVGEDFTEQGLREILNYGHTLGHAIEHAERYRWRHGAAIAIGMMFAAELSRLTRHLPDAAVERHRRILDSLDLPTSYPAGRWQSLLATMKRDKKARGALMRFIVLDDIGRPTTLQGPDESLLFAAYQEIAS
ncbi:3-dehydroquinate synthase [Protaetiibacter intestinalis]|uniref:3-dehydroquinate synthase n=1 Tax=Protaetiibacter intestinalis TaxID=2419774 RepID=A0A387B9T4_9MICO|nr:3-dehydroquinate synthase [Protaetiibacter intestinalis]AYF99113.1 3-dehydroquinate synthase [Protaetiibacter intestinalis]